MPIAKVLYDNAVRRQTLLEGVKQDSAAKFIKFLQAMDKDLRLKLTEDLTNFSQSRINAQIAAIAQSQADIIDSFLMDYEKTINNVAGTEASLEKKALNSAILNKGFEAVIPDSKQIIAAVNKDPFSLRGKGNGITLKPFLEAYKADQIELIRGRITQGFAEGETTSQILQSLRGTKARNYADGILSTIDKNTKTMVRTSLQNVSSAARQSVWEENSDIVESVEWVSVLDARTTEQCQALDGEIFPIDSGPRPPIHYNCRSTIVPVLPEDLQYLEKGAKRPSKGADGVEIVSAKTTYYDWLKTQPDSFQDHVLGVGKAEIFRSGELSTQEFREIQLRSLEKPVTLAEMERIISDM